MDKLLVPMTDSRLFEHVSFAAYHEGVDECLWIVRRDLLYHVLHRHGLWLVQQCHHLTDPANQLPAGHAYNLSKQNMATVRSCIVNDKLRSTENNNPTL